MGDMRNSTLSRPLLPNFLPEATDASASNCISTLNCAFFISRSSNCCAILLSSSEAAFIRSAFSLRAAWYSNSSSFASSSVSAFAVSSLFSSSSSCFSASWQNSCISGIVLPYFLLSLNIRSSLSSISSSIAGSYSALSRYCLTSPARSSSWYIRSWSREYISP